MQMQERTRYTQATDGCALAYDCTEAEGRSGGVLLVHGMGGSRLDWHKYGYVEHLAPYFSVATLDLRGHVALLERPLLCGKLASARKPAS